VCAAWLSHPHLIRMGLRATPTAHEGGSATPKGPNGNHPQRVWGWPSHSHLAKGVNQPPPRDPMGVVETTPNGPWAATHFFLLFSFFIFYFFFIFFFENGILGINRYIRGNFGIFVQKTHLRHMWAIFRQRRQKSLT
jgi:hypothetical protein